MTEEQAMESEYDGCCCDREHLYFTYMLLGFLQLGEGGVGIIISAETPATRVIITEFVHNLVEASFGLFRYPK